MPTRRLTVVAVALALSAAACAASDTDSNSDENAATTPSTPAEAPDSNAAETTDGADESRAPDDASTDDVEVFDASMLHEISISFDQADYDAMIAAYQETGEKEWIEATVTIDGETFEQVGIRLKGNSSLAGLSGRGPGAFGARPGGATDDTTAADATQPEETGRGLPEFGGASADQPQDLPWLIRLSQYVEDQTYQGYEDFVVRSNNSETALNEAVSLRLLADAGLASQDAMATRLRVNGSEDVLRLVVEHPDDDQWYESWFDGDGALYKAESTGDWSYRGDDPASYDQIFDQEGGSDVADLTPLIEFLDFINNADDETFAAGLPRHLDVDAFAIYLAMMELIGNGDDIDGPGNNAYLWWDASTEQFTVVPWDMNLALGTGFGGPRGGAGVPGRGGIPDGALPEGVKPAGGSLPEGMEPPQGGVPAPGDDTGAAGTGGGMPTQGMPRGGGFGGRTNPLVQRFMANDEFAARYEARLAELRTDLVESGTAQTILDEWTETLTSQASDLVSADVIESEASNVEQFLATQAGG